MDPSNEMEYLRVKSCKQEILVASEDEYGWNQVKIWDIYFLTMFPIKFLDSSILMCKKNLNFDLTPIIVLIVMQRVNRPPREH